MAIVLFIHFMNTAQTDTYLPPDPPALVEAASTETEPVDELTRRCQEFTTEIIESGLIARKTEKELIQMLGEFFIQVLAENAFKMEPGVMKHYNDLRERIKNAFPKPAPEKPAEIASKSRQLVLYIKDRYQRVIGRT